MIDQKEINKLITKGLKEAVGCEVVKANLANAPIPPYPYLSFTILNTDTRKGMYSKTDGRRLMPLTQTWSFTVQGDNDNETQIIAIKAKDWLQESGRTYLNDHAIVIQSVGPITNRDVWLSVGYEYRKGFDAVLSLMNILDEPVNEIIETANIVKE